MPRLKAYGLLDCDDKSVEVLNPPSDQFEPQKRPQQEEQVNEENKPDHQQLVEIDENGCVRSGRAEPSDEVSFRHLEEHYHAGSTKHHRTESNHRRKRGSASNRLTRMFRKDDDDKCEIESSISRRRGTSPKRRNSPCHNHLAEEEISISWHRNSNNVEGQQRNQQEKKKELGSTNKSGDDTVTRRNRSCRSNGIATQRRTRSGSLSRRRGRMRTKRRVNSADNIPILPPPKKNRDVVEIDCNNSITSEATMLMSNTINSPNKRTMDIGWIRKKNNSLDSDIKSLETSAAILAKHSVKKMENETDDHTQQEKGLSTKPSSRLRVKDRTRQRSRSRSRREPRTRQARDRSNTDRRRRMVDRQKSTAAEGDDEKKNDDEAIHVTGGSARDESTFVWRRQPPARSALARTVSDSERVDKDALSDITRRLERQKQSEESKRGTINKSRIRESRRKKTTTTRNRSSSVNSRKRRNRNKTSSRSTHTRKDKGCAIEFFWRREPSSRMLTVDKEGIATVTT